MNTEKKLQLTGAAKPLTELVSGTITIDPANAEQIEILGLNCIIAGPIAHVLQRAGYDIRRKAESEQGAVIVWLLSLHRDHGDAWRSIANAMLKRMNDGALAATTAAHGND